MDFFIVMFGVCDVWLLDWIVTLVTGDLHATGAELGQVVVAVRMLRLLRVLRLVRVVKAIRPLYLLAMGVIESMQSMFWVLMLTFVALYISSILVTRVVGHGDFLAFDDETVQARLLFRDVHTSFFTLFAIINSQDWYEVEPLLRVNPIVKLVFVCFIVFCSWALLSIMTGVVADNMILAREYQKEQDKAAHQAHMQDVEQAIKTLLVAADSAGCGRMTKENYGQVLEIPHYARMFRDLAPNSDSKDIRDLFTWLESNDDGVQFDELLEGLRCLCEPVTGQTVLKLDSVVRHKFQGFDKICMLLREDVAHIRRRSQIYQAAILRQMKSGSAEAAPPGLRSQNTITSFSDMVDEIPVQVDN